MRRVVPLWAVFLVVHGVVGALSLLGPEHPLGDVLHVYPRWIEAGLSGNGWVGIRLPWVYPVLALVPMLLAAAFGFAAYPVAWIGLVVIADAAALAVLLGRAPGSRRVAVGWGWTAFFLLLGPIAVGRIDAIAVAVAMAGVALLARRPRTASALLTAAAWIKVWPAALVAAAVIADARRRAIALTAAIFSGVVAVVVLILGGDPVSFIGEQSARGLQLEAPFTTPFLVGATFGGPWSAHFDAGLVTWEVSGPGVDVVAAVTTPVLVLLVAALLALAVVAVRRGADPGRVLAWLGLALVATLIAVNKVGSPQFSSWLAVPIAAGLLATGFGLRAGFGLSAVIALIVAGLTFLIYPVFYDALIAVRPGIVAILALRNALDASLAVLGTIGLVRALRTAPASAPRIPTPPLPEGAPQ